MIGLIAIAAAAQLQTVRLPPATPPNPPTATAPAEVPSPGVTTARLLPDLIVKEIRIDDAGGMNVLVMNNGTADAAGPFTVNGAIEVGGRSVEARQSGRVEALGMGATAWVRLGFFAETADIVRASSATASVDTPYQDHNIKINFGSIFPTSWWTNSTKKECPADRGCVVELDETNNSYAIAGVPRGTPDRLESPGLAPETIPASPPERG